MHLLGQKEDVAGPIVSSQAEVSRSQAVAAVRWVNPSNHHGPKHSCSQSPWSADRMTHRNPAVNKHQLITSIDQMASLPSGYQHTHSPLRNHQDGSAVLDAADAESVQFRAQAAQKQYTRCLGLDQREALANGSTEPRVDGNTTKLPAVVLVELVEPETSVDVVAVTGVGVGVAVEPDPAWDQDA